MGLTQDEITKTQFDVTGNRAPIVPDHTWRYYNHNQAFPNQTRKTNTVRVGLDHNEGGTSGEFTIDFVELGGRTVPQLRVFDDAWQVLHLSNVVAALAKWDDSKADELTIMKELAHLGMTDITDELRGDIPVLEP